MTDFLLQDEGTIAVLQPLTRAARDWVMEHISDDSMILDDGGVVIEHRFVRDIVRDIRDEGLEVE
jgi:hypothetical protein